MTGRVKKGMYGDQARLRDLTDKALEGKDALEEILAVVPAQVGVHAHT